MKMDNELKAYGWVSADRTDAHAYVLPAIRKLLPADKKLNILDAGCGNGYIAGKLAELGHDVVGIDLAEDGIAIARATYPNLRFEVYSVYDDLKGIVNNVDLVISSEVIEHLFYPRTFISNMHNAIRLGGYIILTTPYHGYVKNLLISILGMWDKHHTVDWEGGHIKFFSEKSISGLLRSSGFDNIVFRNAGRIPLLWKSMVCRAKSTENG
jgi:2-polyprenyl-3-methyl-5-hydroxy-6-metoxy-1,4-benzoquinol methylase